MGVKVRQRPSGSGIWWVFIDHQGDRRAKKIGKDERLAQEVARKIEARLILGDVGVLQEEKQLPLYKDYADLWLQTHVKPFRKPTTYERYEDLQKRYILPVFGKKRLDEISRLEVRQFLKQIMGKRSYRTVEFIKDVMSGPFVLAIDEEVITTNPCSGILKRMGASRQETDDYDVYDRKEVVTFLESAKQNEPVYYPLFLTLFRTGLRLGEALALPWSNVDWNGSFLVVKQSFRRGMFGTPKTGKTRRVDMTDQLREELKTLQTRKKREAMSTGKPMSDYIFPDPTGAPLAQNTVRQAFKRAARKAGLREIRVHDARHTYASILISEAAPIAYVKEQLGHASIKMTVDRYAHWIPSGNHYVNMLDTQPTATYPQPAEKQKA